jgi:hypothetical protein
MESHPAHRGGTTRSSSSRAIVRRSISPQPSPALGECENYRPRRTGLSGVCACGPEEDRLSPRRNGLSPTRRPAVGFLRPLRLLRWAARECGIARLSCHQHQRIAAGEDPAAAGPVAQRCCVYAETQYPYRSALPSGLFPQPVVDPVRHHHQHIQVAAGGHLAAHRGAGQDDAQRMHRIHTAPHQLLECRLIRLHGSSLPHRSTFGSPPSHASLSSDSGQHTLPAGVAKETSAASVTSPMRTSSRPYFANRA